MKSFVRFKIHTFYIIISLQCFDQFLDVDLFICLYDLVYIFSFCLWCWFWYWEVFGLRWDVSYFLLFLFNGWLVGYYLFRIRGKVRVWIDKLNVCRFLTFSFGFWICGILFPEISILTIKGLIMDLCDFPLNLLVSVGDFRFSVDIIWLWYESILWFFFIDFLYHFLKDISWVWFI